MCAEDFGGNLKFFGKGQGWVTKFLTDEKGDAKFFLFTY